MGYKQTDYIPTFFSYDIETSSIIDYETPQNSKVWKYLYCLKSNKNYLNIGRNWKDFDLAIRQIIKYQRITEKRRVKIFVHNLGYELEFLIRNCTSLTFDKVFSLDTHSPIYAKTLEGVDFYCSYIASGKSLAKLGDEIGLKKLDLDYNFIRYPKSKLENEVIEYQIRDCDIVLKWVEKTMQQRNYNINTFPITATSFTREEFRRNLPKNKRNIYFSEIEQLNLTEEQYMLYNDAFAGGFTHANNEFVGLKLKNVVSYDKKSFYPYAMLNYEYPYKVSKVYSGNKAKLMYQLNNNKLWVAKIKLTNIRLKSLYSQSNISNHKAISQNSILDNGRIIYADWLITTLTSVDFTYVQRVFDFDNIQFINFSYSLNTKKLPKLFTDFIFEKFKQKEELGKMKNKEGGFDNENDEVNYNIAKACVNSMYGVCVERLDRENIILDCETHEWYATTGEFEPKKKPISAYQWGVFVTSFCRSELLHIIADLEENFIDFVYCDTDSVKFIDDKKGRQIIDEHNKKINQPLELGKFQFELKYDEFKTFGAKKYIVQKIKNDKKIIEITVAGLSKKASRFLKSLDQFHLGSKWGINSSGRTLTCAVDNPLIYDDKGNLIDDKGGLVIIPTTYTLGISRDYLNNINNDLENYEEVF